MSDQNVSNITKKRGKLKIPLIVLAFAVVLCTSAGCAGADRQSSSDPSLSDAEYHITVDDYQIAPVSTRLWKTREDLDLVTIQTIVEVKNTGNYPIEIAEASYDVYLEDGELVETYEYADHYPKILLPGETGYIYEETLYDGSEDDQIYIAPKIVAYRADGDMRMTVDDFDFSTNADGDLKIIGHITNPYDDDQVLVWVIAYLYNSEGNCVGLLRDTLQDVPAGQTVSFDLLCDSGLEDHAVIRSCKVISYVWQLDTQD